MEKGGKNPCDLCKRKGCCFDCALNGYTEKYECAEHECFLNYEGSCMIGLYERCGAWEGT